MFVPKRYDCILLGPDIWDNCIFYILSESVSWLWFSLLTMRAADWIVFIQENPHLAMFWFPLDLRVRTVEQCPCLALSVRMTGARKTPSKAKSPPIQCIHLVIISSLHTVQKQHHPAVITLQTAHHITLLWEHSFNEWRVKWSKWNHPWLSEHLQNNCLQLQTHELCSGKLIIVLSWLWYIVA